MVFLLIPSPMDMELSNSLKTEGVAAEHIIARPVGAGKYFDAFEAAVSGISVTPGMAALIAALNLPHGYGERLNRIAADLAEKGVPVARLWDAGYFDHSRPWAAEFAWEDFDSRDVTQTLLRIRREHRQKSAR